MIFTWQIMDVARFQTSPALNLPMNQVYAGVLLGGVYLIICSIRLIVLRVTGESVSVTGENS
ncbi:hypothetical protein AGMMS50256_34240 [Betaproteobacteria bacterium]|nr:hypothetical protein AGMMS50256_34240 [Betaproteobacteria bacterium]